MDVPILHDNFIPSAANSNHQVGDVQEIYQPVEDSELLAPAFKINAIGISAIPVQSPIIIDALKEEDVPPFLLTFGSSIAPTSTYRQPRTSSASILPTDKAPMSHPISTSTVAIIAGVAGAIIFIGILIGGLWACRARRRRSRAERVLDSIEIGMSEKSKYGWGKARDGKRRRNSTWFDTPNVRNQSYTVFTKSNNGGLESSASTEFLISERGSVAGSQAQRFHSTVAPTIRESLSYDRELELRENGDRGNETRGRNVEIESILNKFPIPQVASPGSVYSQKSRYPHDMTDISSSPLMPMSNIAARHPAILSSPVSRTVRSSTTAGGGGERPESQALEHIVTVGTSTENLNWTTAGFSAGLATSENKPPGFLLPYVSMTDTIIQNSIYYQNSPQKTTPPRNQGASTGAISPSFQYDPARNSQIDLQALTPSMLKTPQMLTSPRLKVGFAEPMSPERVISPSPRGKISPGRRMSEMTTSPRRKPVQSLSEDDRFADAATRSLLVSPTHSNGTIMDLYATRLTPDQSPQRGPTMIRKFSVDGRLKSLWEASAYSPDPGAKEAGTFTIPNSPGRTIVMPATPNQVHQLSSHPRHSKVGIASPDSLGDIIRPSPSATSISGILYNASPALSRSRSQPRFHLPTPKVVDQDDLPPGSPLYATLSHKDSDSKLTYGSNGPDGMGYIKRAQAHITHP